MVNFLSKLQEFTACRGDQTEDVILKKKYKAYFKWQFTADTS